MTRSLRATLSTREAAEAMGRNPGRFREWADAELGVQPLRQARIGRSTVTIWSVAELREGLRKRRARQQRSWGGEIITLGHVRPDGVNGNGTAKPDTAEVA